MQEEKA